MIKKLLLLIFVLLFIPIVYSFHNVLFEYNATSLSVVEGLTISGSLSDTFIDDETSFIIQEIEVIGNDIFILEINFTIQPVDNIQKIILLLNASAIFNEPDDFVEISIFNFNSQTFFTFSEIINETDKVLNLTITSTPSVYISNNIIRTRFTDIDNIVTPINDNLSLDFYNLIINDSVNDINISLIAPDNNTITSNNIVDFEFNIERIANCSLMIDDISVNRTLFPEGNNSFTQNLTVGLYNWHIDCHNGEDEETETRRLRIIFAPIPPFTFCENTIPETIIIFFLFIFAFSFMILPSILRISQLYIVSGVVNIMVGIAYFFLLCLAMLNWLISILFIGLGFFFMAIFLMEVYDKKFG